MQEIQTRRQETSKSMQEPDTGNASNPTPHSNTSNHPKKQQLLDERAEKYLRESANIEDEPDAQDQQDADEIITKENQS